MKKLVIGCLGGCVGIVLLGVACWYFLGANLMDWGKNFFNAMTEQEIARQQLGSDWSPPAPDEAQQWIPSKVGDFQLTEENTTINEFGLEQAQFSGHYVSGEEQVDVFWVSDADDEYSKLTEQMATATQGSGSTMKVQFPHRSFFSSRPPYREFNVWNLRDWVLVVYSEQEGSKSDEFINSLLSSTGDVTTDDELEIPEIDFGGFDDGTLEEVPVGEE